MRAITLFVQSVLLLHHPSSHGSLTYQNNHAFINFASPYIYLISGTINSCAQPSAIRANASFLICIYDLSLSFIIVHFNDTSHHPFIYSLVYLSNCLSIHSFFSYYSFNHSSRFTSSRPSKHPSDHLSHHSFAPQSNHTSILTSNHTPNYSSSQPSIYYCMHPCIPPFCSYRLIRLGGHRGGTTPHSQQDQQDVGVIG